MVKFVSVLVTASFMVIVCSYFICHLEGNIRGFCECVPKKTTCFCQNVFYIPPLPNTTSYLDLFRCHFPILNSTMFDNITVSKIQSLYIKRSNVKIVSKNAFIGFYSLRHLALMYNHIEVIHVSTMFSLRYLNSLNLYSNEITQIHWVEMRFLHTLVLTMNYLKYVPPFKSGNRLLMPVLQYLDLHGNLLKSLNTWTFHGLVALTHLYLSDNSLKLLPENVFRDLPKLYHLVLNRNKLGEISTNALNNRSLRKLYLNRNNLSLLFVQNQNIFHGCTGLEFLDLSKTNIQLTHQHKQTVQVFRPLQKLQNLHLSENYIKNLDLIFFPPSLRRITLDVNGITRWNLNIWANILYLQFLSFDNNKIKTIGKSMLPLTQMNSSSKLDFSRNPLACTCKLVWFSNWAKTNRDMLISYNKYTCFTPEDMEGVLLSEFHLNPELCREKRGNLPLALQLFLGFLFLAIVLLGSVYFLKHLMIVRKRRQKVIKEENYLYDAFICYSVENRKWIIDKLLPRIEVEGGFCLCIHERDFLAGQLIIDNIAHSIERSRQIILVMSESFSCSSWCLYEMNMAKFYGFQKRKNGIIPILLERIPPERQTADIKALLKEKTYLEWPLTEETDGFWQQLGIALSQHR